METMNENWMNLIEEAKERIDGMKPWDALTSYMSMGSMDSYDMAFASVIEAGAFRLEMKHGELHWEFFMPKTSAVATTCRKEVTFMWDEFVPGMEITYAKEIAIPYRDCGIDGFVSVVKAEMDEVMARKLANDLLETNKEEV